MGYYNHRTHSQTAYYFFIENFFSISVFSFYLGVQPSSPKKGWNNEYQICEIERKSEGPLLPRFQ